MNEKTDNKGGNNNASTETQLSNKMNLCGLVTRLWLLGVLRSTIISNTREREMGGCQTLFKGDRGGKGKGVRGIEGFGG